MTRRDRALSASVTVHAHCHPPP